MRPLLFWAYVTSTPFDSRRLQYVTPLKLNNTEILHNPCHVLQALLTLPADHNYNLDRPHNRQLTDRMPHLTKYNYIVRMLLYDSYDCIHCIHFLSS